MAEPPPPSAGAGGDVVDLKEEKGNVLVAVRVRPLNSSEHEMGGDMCVAIEDVLEDSVSGSEFAPRRKIIVSNPKHNHDDNEFVFDFVYDWESAQEEVYADIGAPLLDKAFAGYNATIFAYGQTGSGKTYCMSGEPKHEGIIPRMNKDLFQRIAMALMTIPTRQFLVECSYMEVYNEIIRDLLEPTAKPSKRGLSVKEDRANGVYVKGLRQVVVGSAKMMTDLMRQGTALRHTSATKMNDRSSRSHAIFSIKLRQRDTADEKHNVYATINLVDLAGSERVAKTGATGERLREGANINKSLSELGNVINKLAERGRLDSSTAAAKGVFVPYRNSKLTRVLQNSLGGNSLCCMLATVGPAKYNWSETVTTLRYADRAKSIRIVATKNEEGDQVFALNQEIEDLRARLMAAELAPQPNKALQEKYEAQIREIEGSLKETWEERARLSAQYERERQSMMDDILKERKLLTEKFDAERMKRRRLVEDKGDIELSIREIFGVTVEDPTGVAHHAGLSSRSSTPLGTRPEDEEGVDTLPPPPYTDLTEWVLMVRRANALLQQGSEQSTVATVYCNAVQADVANLRMEDGSTASQESLAKAVSVIDQAAAKLRVLIEEGASLGTTHASMFDEIASLDSAIRVSLSGLQSDDSVSHRTPTRPASERRRTTLNKVVTLTPTPGESPQPPDDKEGEGRPPEVVERVRRIRSPVFDGPPAKQHPPSPSPRRHHHRRHHDMPPRSTSRNSVGSPPPSPIRSEEDNLRRRNSLLGSSTTWLDTAKRPPSSTGADVRAEQVEALKLLLRQVHNFNEAVGVRSAEHRQRAFALDPVLKSALSVGNVELRTPLPTMPVEPTRDMTPPPLLSMRGVHRAPSFRGSPGLLRRTPSTRFKSPVAAQHAAVPVTDNELEGAEDATLAKVLAELSTWSSMSELTKAASTPATNGCSTPLPLADLGVDSTTIDPMEGLTLVERTLLIVRQRLAYRLEATRLSAMQNHLKKEDRIEELETTVERLQSELDSASRAVDDKDAERAKVEATMSKTAADIARLTSELSTKLDMHGELARTPPHGDATSPLPRASSSMNLGPLMEMCLKLERRAEAAETLADDTGDRLADAEAQNLQLQQEKLRLEAEVRRQAERMEVMQSTITRHEKRISYINITVSALRMELGAKKEQVEEQSERFEIAIEERDAARAKEEEYFGEVSHRDSIIELLEAKTAEQKRRIHDLQLAVFDARTKMEKEAASAQDWRHKAITASGLDPAQVAAGSSREAVLKRRGDSAVRALVMRLYQSMSDSLDAMGKALSPVPYTRNGLTRSAPSSPKHGVKENGDLAMVPTPPTSSRGAKTARLRLPGTPAAEPTSNGSSTSGPEPGEPSMPPPLSLAPGDMDAMPLDTLCDRVASVHAHVASSRDSYIEELKGQLVTLQGQLHTVYSRPRPTPRLPPKHLELPPV